MDKESFPQNFKKHRLFKGILLDTENLVSVFFFVILDMTSFII